MQKSNILAAPQLLTSSQSRQERGGNLRSGSHQGCVRGFFSLLAEVIHPNVVWFFFYLLVLVCTRLFVRVPGRAGGRWCWGVQRGRAIAHACMGGWCGAEGEGGGRGSWKTEAQLCSLIFWERSGGVVDPPAPFSSAGSRRISAAASLHKATLCDLPQAHEYNCNQERRERGRRRRDGGQ